MLAIFIRLSIPHSRVSSSLFHTCYKSHEAPEDYSSPTVLASPLYDKPTKTISWCLSKKAHKKVQWNPALGTPVYNRQFCLSRQKAHIFSHNRTDLYGQRTLFCVPSHKLSYIINPDRGQFTSAHCLYLNVLPMKTYKKQASNLSKGLPNIQCAWLSLANKKRKYKVKSWIPLYDVVFQEQYLKGYFSLRQ